MIDFVQELQIQTRDYGVVKLTRPVLEDPRFAIWSGAGGPHNHHYGDGGLAKHTYEVWMLARNIFGAYRCYNVAPFTAADLNTPEILVSVIWHDYGKIWDYQKNDEGVWGKHNKHARQIHHISRSALEFQKHYDTLVREEGYSGNIDPDKVVHNILSHHGMREWGSPVAPSTREAWILHLADNMSARLDDCDRHDKIK